MIQCRECVAPFNPRGPKNLLCDDCEEKTNLYVLEIWLPTIEDWGVSGRCSFNREVIEEEMKECCYKSRVGIYGRKP